MMGNGIANLGFAHFFDSDFSYFFLLYDMDLFEKRHLPSGLYVMNTVCMGEQIEWS